MLCILLTGQLHQLEAKKREVKLHKIEKIREDEHAFKSELHLGERDEEGHLLINGELKQHVTVDNEWKLHIKVHRAEKSDDEFEEFLNIPYLAVCDVMKSYYKELFYESLKEYSNAPHPDTCPLPPEHYHLKDYPLNARHWGNYLIPGYYRLVSKLTKDDEIKLEYLIELEVK
ncbi:uncharacterized protein CheA87a [Drosophila tropicalis]|uniref:uncharacterized protein CheA87a n=1 Tax=Drosophila tropicalis TaxID=46794 RepID=UPI0035ABF519